MEEEIALLSLFPEEVWLIILTIITSKNSVTAYVFYSTTLPFFRKLLHPNLNKIVFPSMLSILHKWCHNRNLPNNNIDADLAILPFRKICREWKRDVDFYLESRLHAEDFSKANRSNTEHTVSSFIYEFSDAETLQAFQQQFDATHLTHNANPFVTAAVKFCFTDSVDANRMQEFLQECVAMLTNYGAHVRACVIDMQSVFKNRCLCWLRHTLHLLPSLQFLKTRNKSLLARIFYGNIVGLPHVQHIPRLQNLQFLEMEMLHANVSRELLRQNGHVPKVKAKARDETEGLSSLHGTQELALSLETIALEYPRPSENYPRFHWQQLRKLELNQRQSHTKIGFLFYFLEYHFAETLQELRLFVPNSLTEDMPLGLLKLNRLQVLQLHLPEKFCIPKRICSLHFIVPLKNTLQELSVWRELESGHDIDKDECFGIGNNMTHQNNFFSARNELQKSNMWTSFPQLEKLAYICTGKEEASYTRKQFDVNSRN